MYATKASSLYASSLYASRPLPQLPPPGSSDPQPAQALTLESIDILLPTGLIIALLAPKNVTLQGLKAQVFKEARNYPLFNLLKDPDFYNFLGVKNDGTREEFVDEKQLLCDVSLFQPILKLVERQGSQEEKLFNAELSNLIGARVHDFEVMGKEIREFRRGLFQVCKATVDRRVANEHSQLKYHYPPALESSDELPKNLRKIYSTYEGSTKQDGQKRNLTVSVLFFGASKHSPSKISRYEALVEVSVEALAEDLVELALIRQQKYSDIVFEAQPHECVLKVVGRQEYLIERKPISQYKCIRSAMLRGTIPKLVVKTKRELLSDEVEYFVMPHVWQDLTLDEIGNKELHEFAPGGSEVNFVSTWNIVSRFSMKIISASHVNVAENHKVFLRCGLYHGGEALCDASTTRPEAAHLECCHWNENLEYDLKVCDIPRSAKLCYVLYSSRDSQAAAKAKKKKKVAQKETIPIAWANQAVFDYACNLHTGVCELYMWPIHEELCDSLNYMGTTVLNSASHDTVCLKVEISTPLGVPEGHPPIMFPSREMVHQVHASQIRPSSRDANKKRIKELLDVVNRDPLAELSDQDKELVFYMREYCLYEMPLSLPKLVQSVTWNNHFEVAEMYDLLQNWQALPPEKAMELLDHHYPDIAVRNWAVNSLENMDDTTLSKYLLQLVQVLKFEMYLDTALGQFLLKRALLNKRIGHTLFWHLRAEMHLPEVTVRFGLMLEAYCRGCGSYMQDLVKQFAALDCMRQISQTLQKASGVKKEQLKKTMQDMLQSPLYSDVFCDLRSPLDCSLQLASCSMKDCKYMDSKMKPLWMVFNNLDPLGDKIFQIFKQGDDLRQDMLTLQILGIMDSFWQQEGLDLKMVPYGCLSTGNKIGMIEVVLNTQTLAKIQKVKGGGATGAFKNHILLDFLKEHNPSGLDQAVDVFTKSCAGYCVATYVLGIGDRHSDNIMLAENGNLLHIDFGHFLGNFKSKLGVKRERVPFVLTNDFVFTIVKGDKAMEQHPNFKVFKKLCEDAFLLLRKHGDLFINLFAMMLSTGIPELRTAQDVDYVRDALCLGQTHDMALKSFQSKFQEAIKNNRTVAINWWMHNIAKQQN